jgi:hypothetical protein
MTLLTGVYRVCRLPELLRLAENWASDLEVAGV